jgi:hypothetical protein
MMPGLPAPVSVTASEREPLYATVAELETVAGP